MLKSLVLTYKVQSKAGLVEELKEYHASKEGAEIALFNASTKAKRDGATVIGYDIKTENSVCPVVKKLSQTESKYASLK